MNVNVHLSVCVIHAMGWQPVRGVSPTDTKALGRTAIPRFPNLCRLLLLSHPIQVESRRKSQLVRIAAVCLDV